MTNTYGQPTPSEPEQPTWSASPIRSGSDADSSLDGPSDSSALGRLIRARRTELDVSLADVAARVGCTRSYLSMIETGVRGDGGAAISPVLLVRLESVLGLAPGLLTKAAQWSAT